MRGMQKYAAISSPTEAGVPLIIVIPLEENTTVNKIQPISSNEQKTKETNLNNETSGQSETDQQALDNEAQERADSVADGGGDAGNRSMTSSAYEGRADLPNAPDAKENFNEAG